MGYPGGKAGAGVYQQIINLMPPHRVYVEPFLGGGAVMARKRPAAENVGLDLDPEVIATWRRRPEACTVIHGDGIRYLAQRAFAGDELVYCDPPYLPQTRTRRRIYANEMTAADHARLLDVIAALPCRVMISGYWSRLYSDRLAGWSTANFPAVTRGGTVATEWLWFNFVRPVELHDYSFLGADFRERERIGRKKKRWIARLRAMPTLERQALLSAIEEAIAPR